MKNLIQYGTALVAVVTLAMTIVNYVDTPSVAVVDFKRLVNEYQGMLEATQEYEDKMVQWNHMNDSLSNEIKMALEDYYADSAYLSKNELALVEGKIVAMRNKYVEFTQGLEANAQLEDQKMTSEVVAQVLSFVDKYGAENGYDVILGRNEGNDVLYKSTKLDITNELIAALNYNYGG